MICSPYRRALLGSSLVEERDMQMMVRRHRACLCPIVCLLGLTSNGELCCRHILLRTITPKRFVLFDERCRVQNTVMIQVPSRSRSRSSPGAPGAQLA